MVGSYSSTRSPGAPYYYISPKAYIRLYKVVSDAISGSPLDEVLIYCPATGDGENGSGRNSFVTSLFAESLKKNELYAITITPDDDPSLPWVLGMGLSADGQFDNIVYFPSVMLYNI